MSGRVIAVEGLDGCGKSTLIGALAEALGAHRLSTPGARLRGVRADFDAELSPCPLARGLGYLATVAAAGRRARALAIDGQDVLIDRYAASTLAYAPPQVARRLGPVLADLEPVDLTLYLELDEPTRAARLTARPGTTAEDRATLDPAANAALRAAYARHLAHRVHGALLPLQAAAPPAALLAEALHRLRAAPAARPRRRAPARAA